MWMPHPPLCRVVDAEGVTHLVCLACISRVTYLGTEESPDVEVWVQFGGVLRLSGEQATRFLNIYLDWGHELRPG
jgi:hypothetical protein